ncbi:MAG TPA: hypothetical protein VIL84_02780 [Devosiaceae bacterium]
MLTWIILLLSLIPILKFVLWPARAMGRGGGWTFGGALVIVAAMMILFLGLQSMLPGAGSPDTNVAQPDQTAKANAAAQADIAALKKLDFSVLNN